jgi:hypothetical protein
VGGGAMLVLGTAHPPDPSAGMTEKRNAPLLRVPAAALMHMRRRRRVMVIRIAVVSP